MDNGAQRQKNQGEPTMNSPAFVVSDDAQKEMDATAGHKADAQAAILAAAKGDQVGQKP